MRLDLERSGGFAGRTLRWSLDVDGLGPADRAEVQELLAQAPEWPQDAGGDRFSYRLTTAQPETDRPDTGRNGSDPDGTDPDGTDPDGTDPDGTEPLDVRFVEPLPAPARRLVQVIRQSG